MMQEDYHYQRSPYGENRGWRLKLNVDALTLFILGLGLLGLIVGPCLGLYGIGPGFVVLVVAAVMAIPLRLFLITASRNDD